MAGIDTVGSANTRFYRAVSALDLTLMEACWLREDHISCVRHGRAPRFGWGPIMESWERIFSGVFAREIAVSEFRPHVVGSIAWALVTEEIATSTYDGRTTEVVQATNIFERRDGLWLLAHHHAAPVGQPSPSSDRRWH